MSFESPEGKFGDSSSTVRRSAGNSIFRRASRFVTRTLRFYLPLPTISGPEKQNQERVKKWLIERNRSISNKHEIWNSFSQTIFELVKERDLRRFLVWKPIVAAMFHDDENRAALELQVIQADPNWETRWKSVCEESQVGSPIFLNRGSDYSGNSIHQTYHLLQLERALGVQVNDFDFIIEFGGGYGKFAHSILQSGYSGEYLIYDLPELVAIQSYYLSSSSVPHSILEEGSAADARTGSTDSLEYASDFVSRRAKAGRRGLFVALWSLSETPVNSRERYFPLLEHCDAWFFAVRSQFENEDNDTYLKSIKQRLSPDCSWITEPVPLSDTDAYIIGALPVVKSAANVD